MPPRLPILNLMELLSEPHIPTYRTVISRTWLSDSPDPKGFFVSAIAILLIAIGSVLYWNNTFSLTALMPASRDAVLQGHEWWRLFTALIAHGDPGHFLSNAFLFFALGSFLIAFFGSARVLLWAVFFGALTNYVVISSMRPGAQLLGASGVVFWMGGAWLALYLLLDRKRTLYQRSLRALGVGLALFMPSEAFDPSISYHAHAVGFGFGILWGVGHFVLNRSRFRAAEVHDLVRDEEFDPGP